MKYILLFAVLALTLRILASVNRAVNLKSGDIALGFTADSTIGKISLSQFTGQYVILYFYPKDMSPGCTMQANEFGKLYKELKKRKVEVIGISKDSLESHNAFAKKYKIPYPLISDIGGKISNAYGALYEKSIFGIKYTGITRSSFLIGPDQKIIAIIHKVNPKGHATELLEVVQGIKE